MRHQVVAATLALLTVTAVRATQGPLEAASAADVQQFNKYNVLEDAFGAYNQFVASVPDGAFVEIADPTCSDTGLRVHRYWFGSTEEINSVQAADPSSTSCDQSQEEGEDAVHAFVKYMWTTWPVSDERSGLRCDDQGLGSITLTTAMEDPSNPGTMLNSLFVCKVTYSWEDYEEATYKRTATVGGVQITNMAHPFVESFASTVFVKPADIRRVNNYSTFGIVPVHTWACDWVPTSKNVCGYDMTTPCNAECYKEENGGCVFDNGQIEYQRLMLAEVVVEIAMDPSLDHPPDVYLYKPHPLTPDGMPVESGFLASSFDTDAELELRLANFWSGTLPQALKWNLYGDEYTNDVMMALSTDNFGQLEQQGIAETWVLFDDSAMESVHGVDNWASGALRPEDSLSLFRARIGTTSADGTVGLGGGGGGTWTFVVSDDCGDSGGSGSELAHVQIHFVCKQPLFCAQTKQTFPPPPPPFTGSGSGDPHFVGFQGQTFDYHGAPGATFNVISTPDTLVNAKLRPDTLQGLTYMSTVGISTLQGVRVQVTAMPQLGELMVEVNDVPLSDASEATWTKGVEVTTSHGGLRVTVKVPEMEIEMSLHKGQFIDISAIRMAAEPAAMHGVLGNTVNLDPDMDAEYIGEDADYFVSSLWSSDFEYNVYGTDAGVAAKKSAAHAARPHAALQASAINIDAPSEA